MSCTTDFGKCLDLMLFTLDIRNSAIARALNVDSSLVNRWIHGKRIPPYRSQYIEAITEFLSASVLNSIQEKKLDEAILSMSNNICEELSLKEKIRITLLEAQGYSLEMERIKTKKLSNEERKKKVGMFENNYIDCDSDKVLTKSSIVRLSEMDSVIIGTRNILTAVVELMEEVKSLKCVEGKNNIYITLTDDGGGDFTIGNLDLLSRLRECFHEILNKGWNIKLYFYINNNLRRTIHFIRFIQPMLSSISLQPYYYKKYDVAHGSRDVVSIPEIAALSVYSVGEANARYACFLRTTEAVKLMTKHLISSTNDKIKPLLRYYPLEDKSNIINELFVESQIQSERYVFRDFFNIVTLPTKLYKRVLNRFSDKNNNEIRLKLFRMYKRNFYKSVNIYNQKEIYMAETIAEFIKTGKYKALSPFDGETFILMPEEVVEHLYYIVKLLKKFKNYEIALIRKDLVSMDNLNYTISGNQLVRLEAWDDGLTNGRNTVINEPTFIKAFEENFLQMWDGISPVNREKNDVIKWLERQIEIQKSKLTSKKSKAVAF